MRASFQEEAAYRANFFINLLHSLLNLATGVLGIAVLFGQVETVNGWSGPTTLALLGVYLTVGAMRSLFIGPSLEALAGMDGQVWTGQFDFTVLRPINKQFLASLRKWHLFALFDLALGAGVIAVAVTQLGQTLTVSQGLVFLAMLAVGVTLLYALLLALAALTFWSPGVLFTWMFDGLFQMARFPLGLYPGWLRLVLTWIIPVGVITTVPVEALTGTLSIERLAGSVAIALAFVTGASALFHAGLKRYASASS
jgi:ABC-2 type transport system permease protein